MKRHWTDRSKVGTPGDPVRGTAAVNAMATLKTEGIPQDLSPDEQDHQTQRLAAYVWAAGGGALSWGQSARAADQQACQLLMPTPTILAPPALLLSRPQGGYRGSGH